MQQLKLTREFISSFLKGAIPEYEDMLVSIEKNGGWIISTPKVSELLGKLNALDYPLLYRRKYTISKALSISRNG